MSDHFVITIGREYGSGGHEVGSLVAKELGIPLYDKEVLALAAQSSGICKEIFEHHDEKASMSSLFYATPASGLGGMSFGLQMPMNQRVFLAQFEAITKLASEQSCVIVGRCADYVLRDMAHVTHVFVYASMERRVERIMRVENVDQGKAQELIRKTDKQRKNYYNFFADGNWGLRSNYDLMLRTDGHTTAELAELVVAFAKAKAANRKESETK
ncbi:MAG: cytidylate kinase-like family protein [Eubacteriales bacterium]|nr:cytidylate kinase-like family protein [Eubacteriales bacterium]